MNFQALILVLGLVVLPLVASSSPHCIDDSGSPVDWYIVYKFPYLKSHNQPDLFGGYHYAYMSSKTRNGWHFSKHQVTEPSSILGQTLAPYFSSNRSHLTAMFYNDQPPTHQDVPSSYAHAKGMMISDSKQGFWLIHTVPKFVAIQDKYEYVATGGRYGQVAMCLSLSASELTKVVRENFLTARPFVYSVHIASDNEKTELGKALVDLEHHRWTEGKNYSDLSLTTLGGEHFRSFYKSPKHEVDLYAGIVAPVVGTCLRAETWRHPPGGPLDSECEIKRAEVENIQEIKLKFVDSSIHGQFSSMDDHSKWAISRDQQHKLVCIGDINRVHSQFHRGGGTTCITESDIWSSFNSLISKIERCPDDKFWSRIFNKIFSVFH